MALKRKKVLALCAVALSSMLFAEQHGTHWGYAGHEAPEHWGVLSPEYKMCKEGVSQSPIDISKKVTVAAQGLEAVKFDYKTDTQTILNNGHTVQVNFKPGSSIALDGIVFDLKQVHFHTPSENTIEGKRFPLEAHFVHISADGKLAVVAVLFEEGAANEALDAIWSKMPKDKDKTDRFELPFDKMSALLPQERSYYRFSGSLTTPPCSEGVRWIVMKQYVSLSKEQVKTFFDLMGGANNRPVQPINARKVLHR